MNRLSKVLFKSEKGISTLSLNRPDSFNALDVTMLNQLLEVVEELEQNDDQIVIFTGEGKAFCAGGDITMMQEMHNPEEFDRLMDLITQFTIKMYSLPKIVLTAVNGSAAGLGLSFALNSDYIIANNQAKFGMLFAGIGLIPDGGGHFFLEERIGVHKAKQFIWSLQQIAGEEAEKFGFIDVMTEGDALGAAKQFGQKLLTSSPLLAMIETKNIYHRNKLSKLRNVLEEEKKSQLKMRQTADHREGVQAFLEKRRPHFKGE